MENGCERRIPLLGYDRKTGPDDGTDPAQSNVFPLEWHRIPGGLLPDRVNWLSVVDTIAPWDRDHARTSPRVLA